MSKTPYNILPSTQEILKTMGEQIKLARLRRNLSVELVSERAGFKFNNTKKSIKEGEIVYANKSKNDLCI